MQRRTLCCPLQMVQYLSQVQRSSGRSHCMQTVGACIRPSGKTVPEPWSRGKAKVGRIRRIVYLLCCVCRKFPFTTPSLTRLCVHASIDFCPRLGMESITTPLLSELRKTPLNAIHRRLGAKMVNFGGWDMPVEYPSSGGLIAEHKAVRGSVGVFDVSHMGDIRIRSGSKAGGALAAVQPISMNDASKLAVGQAHYSAMLYPEGTFVDDVIVHRLGEDDFLLVINAGTRQKDIDWVRQNTKGFDCVVEELSDAYTQLAIQGPRAAEVLQKLTDVNLAPIKNYWFTHGTVCGLKNVLIARTGYTGEDGFEIYVPSDQATSEQVWGKVM